MSTAVSVKSRLALHDSLAGVMSDARFDDGRANGSDLRAFVVAYMWARAVSPDRDSIWRETLRLSGLSTHNLGDRHTDYRVKGLFRADAPRYEPTGYMRRSVCPVLMQRGPRVGEPCGRPGTYSFRVTDPDTGEWEHRGWCRSHEAHANVERELEKLRPKRDPLPNTGGLLPGYIRASNWPDLYTAASYNWTPPNIGIDANDWPVLTKVEVHARDSRSGFVALDGESEAVSGEDFPRPNLTLVSE